MSIAEWVRQALDLARRRDPVGGVSKKLEVIRAAAQHDYPVTAIGRHAGRDRKGIRNERASVILVDSNIPMYLVGAPHAHKSDARRLLEKVVSERRRLVPERRVLQEILHRYVAIDRRDAIQPAFDALLGIVDQVLPVDRPIAERAKQIVLGIGSCLRVMPYISRQCNITESSKS